MDDQISNTLEMRCRLCLRLHDTELFATHDCQPHGISEDEFLRLRDIKKSGYPNPQQDVGQTIFLSDLQEVQQNKSQKNNGIIIDPLYNLHFMIQDRSGRVVTTAHSLTRSLSQILGFTQTIAKVEKENEIGGNAKQMLSLLLDPQAKHGTNKQEVRRISLQHFLNEILSSSKNSKSAEVFFKLKSLL